MKDGKDLADSWKAAFIESSAKQHEVGPSLVGGDYINLQLFHFPVFTEYVNCLLFDNTQTVKEIFKMVLLEIERQSGDVVDQKGTCTIS
jgi:hypothetical protein